MPENKLQGLKGLQGLGGLSKAQYDSFIEKNRDLISQHGYDPTYINNLYSNKQFIDKYGVERFKAIPDIDMRNAMYRDDIVNTEFNKLYNPVDIKGIRNNNRGLGADFEKYNQLSTDAKLKLMESDYLTPSEFETQWKKDVNAFAQTNKKRNNIGGFTRFMRDLAGMSNPTGGMLQNIDNSNNILDNEALKQKRKEYNDKILQRIYNDDVDNAASRFASQVADAYYSSDIAAMSDSQVKEAFVQAINGNPRKGDLGIPELASHYGNGTESQITSEMQDFSIDDMRQVLAKKRVYDAYMSPDMAMTALNNDAKRYIKDHQGSMKRFGLFLKDVGISSMSYTADKLNGIAELYRVGQDALAEKPIVMVDDRGNVLDPKKIRVVSDKQGRLHYQDKDGQLHSVHQEQVDYTTLHNMGKNPDGSDIEGAFGVDWMTLNPQYWTRAEQYGTLDENEQKQYEKLGSSPYKIVYNPNEDSDIMYEAFKMMSFGIADAASQLIPYGVGMLGKSLSTANKVGKVARGFGKVLDTTGKMLTAETKVGQVAQGTAGALGIAYAYGRGAFQETLQQNLANAEEAAQTASRNDIYNQYNSDKDYKAGVDKLINARAASMKADYLAKMQRDSNMRVTDENTLDKMIHARAQEAVLGELVQNRVKERMASKEYVDLQQKAIDGAGDAAFNSFLTEGIKYGFVNNFGYRKYLYTNPAGLSKKVSSTFKGLGEITTKEGRQRLTAGTSKFLTRNQKLKEFGKTLGSQAWGGAWTNGTDDMQVDAAERINNDSFKRYLDAYQNGEAIANTYGFADGLYSYMKGLSNSMGQETTLNAALVGGLGSVVNFTPNFANIARLATKEGRDAYINNFTKRVVRDENGIPVKNEDGSIKYEDLKRKDNWRERANYFIQNGVLNTYYGKKQSERDLQSHADYVNDLLDSYNDFKDIEGLVASNVASENLESQGDVKTLQFIKALHSINALNRLGENSNDPTTLSSVVQNAKNLIAKASQLNEENGESPFSKKEIKNLLSQYYAANPDLDQSEYNSQKALYTIAQNAQKLQEASEAFDKAEDEIQKIERNRGEAIDPEVRTKMKIQQALNGHWEERKQKMKSEIDDASVSEQTHDASTIIASVGGIDNAKALVKVYDKQKTEIEKELIEQQKRTKTFDEEYRNATKELNTARSNEDSDAVLKAEKKQRETKARLDSSKEQESYLERLVSMTEDKKKSLEENFADTSTKILTADEIFALDPVTRARMMNKDNRELYSKEQQREIEKLEQRLIMRDADALQKIQDIALLTQRIDSNKDAYSRMAQNPEAAAVSLEAQRLQSAEAAYKLIGQRNAETVADYINKFDEGLKNRSGISEDSKNNYVFRTLRKLNTGLLDIIDEDSMLPKYQQQVVDAKEWGKVVEDVASVISQSDKGEDWQNNILKNIDTIVESANNKEEIMSALEKVIDDTEGSESSKDFEYILDGMRKLGYLRDATIIENRKQRKEREAEEAKKKEEEKKKVDEAAKNAAEKEVAEEKEKQEKQENMGRKVGKNDNLTIAGDVDLFIGEEPSEEPQKDKIDNEKSATVQNTAMQDATTPMTQNVKTILSDGSGDMSVTAGEMWNGTGDNAKKGKFTVTKMEGEISFDTDEKHDALSIASDEYEVTPETKEHGENAMFEASSMVKKGDDWYFVGNFAGTNKTTEVKAKKSFDIEKAIERQQEARETELAAKGVDVGNVNIIDNGDSVQGVSASIDEQINDIDPNGKEVHVSETNVDADDLNSTEEHNREANATTLSGNAMSRYEPDPLEKEGSLVNKKGTKANDGMNQYYAWMDAAGIKLQNIIDQELGKILRRNSNAKVKFMSVRPESNATNDSVMQKHLMLVLDYDNNINKGITAIHNDMNGGVIESNGKKYLVIGVTGFAKKNFAQKSLYDVLTNPISPTYKNSTGEPLGLMIKPKKEFFDNHSNERFYVNENLSTEIVPYSLIPGYIVKQGLNDSNTEFRSVRELLADKERNPMGYDMQSVAWGIQELTKFLTVGTSVDNVMVPRNTIRNAGSAFVFIPAGNGKLIPSYLKVLKYNEMKDGVLKDKVERLLQDVVAPDYVKRYQAVMDLCNIFYFDKDGDNILLKKTKAEVSLVHDGKVQKTFTLDSNFDRMEFMKAMEDMNPRVNITARVLQSQKLLKEYDEAGALMTDIAMFGTAGSSYSIYGLDGEGNMLKSEQPVNETLKTVKNSDFKNENKSQVIYKHQYYTRREDDGMYYLNGEPVTDEKLIKQLDYNKMIIDNQLSPIKNEGVWEYFILKEGEHPEAIKVNRNTKEVKNVSEEKAKEIIQKIEEETAKKQRDTEAQKQLKTLNLHDVEIDLTGDSETTGFIIDPETGEMIADNTVDETPVVKEEKKVEEKTKEVKRESEEKKESKMTPIGENSPSTQTFAELYGKKAYRMNILKLIKGKWKDAPSVPTQLEKFLRNKDVEVDSIGTSKDDIDAWMKTIEDCR